MGMIQNAACTPGGPFYSGFSLWEMGLSATDIAAVSDVAVTLQRNEADDPSMLVKAAPVAGSPGRYVVSGTIPESYVAGDTIILWAHMTLGGVMLEFRFDLFSVMDARSRNLLDVATGIALILKSLQAN